MNLALNRPAIQSSNYHKFQTYDNWAASLAVDGNVGTCAFGGDEPGGPNWFVVDLGQQYYVQYVVLIITDANCESINT